MVQMKNCKDEIKEVFDAIFWLDLKERPSPHIDIFNNPFANVPTSRVFKEQLEEDKQIWLMAWEAVHDIDDDSSQKITKIVLDYNDAIKKL